MLASLAFVVARFLGRDERRRPTRFGSVSLPAGAYLFTSGTCEDCLLARAAMNQALGSAGYREIGWESEPEIFETLGIEAVPATLLVAKSGRATLYPGQPGRALKAFNP